MESVIKFLCSTLLVLGWISLCEAQCPSNLSNTTFFITDPENCQDYWMCSSTVQKKMKCPSDHCFDTSLNECTYRNRNDCENDGELFPDCNNCTRYWQCSNGKKTHMICPNYPKLWFNFVNFECDYIRNYPVLHGCGDILCTSGPDRRKYAVDHDKRKFVWCISGKAYLYSCCDDKTSCHFDVDQQLCYFEPTADTGNSIQKDRYIYHKDSMSNASTHVCGMSPLLPVPI